MYVGSSNNVHIRIMSHKRDLRKNCHPNSRLSAAFEKHGENLVYALIESCEKDKLREREQFYIDCLKPSLNISPNAYSPMRDVEISKRAQEVRKKSIASFIENSRIAAAADRGIAVDCDDGRTFISASEAAREFGVTNGTILHLARKQSRSRSGYRFKITSSDWLPEISRGEMIKMTREKNGTKNHPSQNRKKVLLSDGRSYNSLTEAALDIGMSIGALSTAIKLNRVIKKHLTARYV